MSKRVASIVRAENSGLGNLSWDFYRHDIFQKSLIIPARSGEAEFFERFEPDCRIADKEDFCDNDLEWLLEDIDTLLCFETCYRDDVFQQAKKRGIKTILMPMHEGRMSYPLGDPDVWLCPSELEYEKNLGGEKIRINVPVDTERIEWKLRTKAKKFIHNSGHGGIGGRNGTAELISALPNISSPAEFIIRAQSLEYPIDDERVNFRYENVKEYWNLWKEGDVFVIPDKFAGLSMPMQEAFASGMMVMATDRYPINTWLPKECLIPVEKLGRWNSIEVALIESDAIAETIDKWYHKDISKYSKLGKKWAEENSWEKLKHKYKEICEK